MRDFTFPSGWKQSSQSALPLHQQYLSKEQKMIAEIIFTNINTFYQSEGNIVFCKNCFVKDDGMDGMLY